MTIDSNGAAAHPHQTTIPLVPLPETANRPEGKSPSCRNATKNGLFAARDFIRPGEEKEYAQTLRSLMAELSPEGVLEETFATEIMGANWRLRRCRMVEHSLAGRATPDPALPGDPAEEEQKSVDRARALSHNILRRSVAELRKLQTERAIRIQLSVQREVLGLADSRQVMNTARSQDQQRLVAREGDSLATLQSLIDQIDQVDRNSFCKSDLPPVPTPRNALCPCGSGAKYKRCCGKAAPPALRMAAASCG